jgi:lipopolysaccharide/colanic/teichoic acid biosynthesis glycosyltransferase
MSDGVTPEGLSWSTRGLKRSFDLAVATVGLLLLGWLILLGYLAATLATGKNGFFTQPRVGRNGRIFSVVKLRTMRDLPGVDTTVTHSNDPRITRVGRLLRKSKIDELPQLLNVFLGQMSFVGPRPDVPGYADELSGADRIILTVRPGITGPATLAFRHEEELLARQPDPEAYNRSVIYPEKVRLNREYVENYRFGADIRYIARTVFGR